MVDDMTQMMFECEGEPKQLNAEIGHMFLVDRGKPFKIYVTYPS